MDVGLLLDRHPVPAGRRVALIGNVGGPLILGADAADAGGLDVPVLSAPLQQEIAGLAPAAAATAHPVDLSAAVTAEELAAVVKSVAASGEVDACLIVCVEIDVHHRLDDIDSLLAAVEPAGVPLALTLIGTADCRSAELPSSRRRSGLRPPWRSPPSGPGGWPRSPMRTTSQQNQTPRPGCRAPPRERPHRRSGRHGLVGSGQLVRAARSGRRACGAVGLRRLGSGLCRRGRSSRTVGRHQGRRDRRAAQVRRRRGAAGHRRRGDSRRGLSWVRATVRREPARRTRPDPASNSPRVACRNGAGPDVRTTHRGWCGWSRGRATRRPGGARCPRVQNRRPSRCREPAPGAAVPRFRGRPELPVDDVVEFVHRLGLLATTVPEIQQLDLNPVLVSTAGCVAVDALVAVAAPAFPVVPVRGLRGRPTWALPVG